MILWHPRLISAALATLLAAATIGASWASESPLELSWEQLIPHNETRLLDMGRPTPQGMVMHGQISPGPGTEMSLKEVVTRFNGKRVQIPGFMVPIVLEGAEVKEFLLVPYFGACIHVPPPPPNQIIFVTSEEVIAVAGLFEPVVVTGIIDTVSVSTELADQIGYQIEADEIVPYDFGG